MNMGLEIFFAEQRSELNLQYVGKQIVAGFPSPAEDYLESTLDLNKELIKNPSSTFFGLSNKNCSLFILFIIHFCIIPDILMTK